MKGVKNTCEVTIYHKGKKATKETFTHGSGKTGEALEKWLKKRAGELFELAPDDIVEVENHAEEIEIPLYLGTVCVQRYDETENSFYDFYARSDLSGNDLEIRLLGRSIFFLSGKVRANDWVSLTGYTEVEDTGQEAGLIKGKEAVLVNDFLAD